MLWVMLSCHVTCHVELQVLLCHVIFRSYPVKRLYCKVSDNLNLIISDNVLFICRHPSAWSHWKCFIVSKQQGRSHQDTPQRHWFCSGFKSTSEHHLQHLSVWYFGRDVFNVWLPTGNFDILLISPGKSYWTAIRFSQRWSQSSW